MALGSLKKGSLLKGENVGGGGSTEQVALLSITTAPASPFAVGSKYYNSSTKKIVTAITADTWTGATESDPQMIPVYYLFDGGTYYWDGNTLEKLGSLSCGSNIPFSIKSANIGNRGEVDLFNITKFVNSGCSFTGTVATGGDGKYVRLFETAPLTMADSWTINVPKYTYNGGGTGYNTIMGMSTSKDFQTPTLLTSTDGLLKFYASTAGETWDIFNSESTGLTLSIGTSYWFKISYDSVTGYKIDYSSDGINYTNVWSSATTTKAYCGTAFMFLNNGEAVATPGKGFSFGGMDFSTGSIIIDGETWFDFSNLSNSLAFKVDDGTLYSDLKVIGIDGQEHTFNTLSDLDLSGFADGVINIFAISTGAEARKNKIFMQTAEPTPINDGDVWVKGNEVFDWDSVESEWVNSTVIAFLGSIIKNGLIENGYCYPINYNGKCAMNCFSYVNGVVEYDLIAKTGFKFYGRYKDNLKVESPALKYPLKFNKFYNTNYAGIHAGGVAEADGSGLEIISITPDVFSVGGEGKLNNVILEGYLTIN